jgi:hypothetical protein
VDDLTKRRLAHNEQLFREINEERERATAGARLVCVCECSDQACTGRIEVTVAEYERIRQSPDRYIVLPGHVIPEIERIVEERGVFAVVEKNAA